MEASQARAEAREARRNQKLWKINDEKANKSGACQAIYWVKEQKSDNPLKNPNEKSWSTGTVYKGEWINNKKHGYGIQVWSNGNKYEGDWAKGFRDGHGVFWVKKDGKLRKQYAGNWKRGQKSGLGVFFYPDGSRYEGNWEDGMRQGRGTLFMENGDVYVGDWNQDKQSGFGTLTKKKPGRLRRRMAWRETGRSWHLLLQVQKQDLRRRVGQRHPEVWGLHIS
mmetsp:Transcript_6514/g.10123  ORF Transcript_6514/g.10123 Transcript_6514/m.10123 type:complete len:223 (-) Transcript_6514:683-1351(-)